MSRTWKAVIRADAAPDIGAGHIVRCLALAQALRAQGVVVSLVTYADTLDTVPVSQDGFDRTHVIERPGSDETGHADETGALVGATDFLIIDSYALGSAFETAARAWAKRICVIDDAPTRPHDTDMLIDPTYGRDASEYGGCAPSADVLAGSEYALLRKAFHELREKTLQARLARKGRIENVLVAFGGSETGDLTATVIDVVTRLKELRATLLSPQPSANRRKTVLSDYAWDGVANLMAQADLAIGACGGMSWERCALGLPAIAAPITENQNEIATLLWKHGAAEVLRMDDPQFALQLELHLRQLMADPDQVITMSHNAAVLCDGLGAMRVAERLCELMSVTSSGPHA